MINTDITPVSVIINTIFKIMSTTTFFTINIALGAKLLNIDFDGKK